MARKPLISEEVLLRLLKDFFIEECNGNPDYIKIPEAAMYIQKHGYPKYSYESLRKNTAAKKYFKELKEKGLNSSIKTLASYSTLDVNGFIMENNTKPKMIAALTKLDTYYQEVAKTALVFYEENAQLKKALAETNEKVNQNNKDKEHYETKISDLKAKLKETNDQLKAAMDYIDNTLYEGFAYNLLKEKLITVHKPESIEDIPAETFKDKTIRGDMDIIDFMAQTFEEDDR